MIADSSQKLLALLDDHFLIIRFKRNGIIAHINNLYYQATLNSTEQLEGVDVAALTHADMSIEELVAFKKCLLEGRNWSGTLKVRGIIGALSLRGLAFPDPDGDVKSGEIIFIGFDITTDIETGELNKENAILFEILHDSYYFEDINSFYQSALERITSIPWLELQRKAGIMLTDLDEMDGLRLIADFNLGDELKKMCAHIHFGQCLCGKAAQERQIIFKSCLDEDHSNHYSGMKAHGHYNIPLIYQNRLLGVLFLYIAHGHEQKASELGFLERLGAILSSAIAQREAEKERDIAMGRVVELQQTIQRYTPQTIWHEAGQTLGSRANELPAHARHLSFLFLDIKDFTQMAESMPPEKVIALLNEYFAPCTDIILAHEGEVERFIGDGIFASFITPASAARSALLIARKFQEINQARSDSDIKLNFRMGINAGTAVQGNVGSHDRMEYTIIGDAVNLASRLESRCEPGHILISQDFFKLGLGNFLAHEPFEIEVKGKEHPIQVRYLYGYRHLPAGK